MGGNDANEPTGSIRIESMGCQVTPNWLSNLKKLPSLLKLMESDFFLTTLKRCDPMSPAFQFMLSGFLTSSRSILWHLLSEYSTKYNVELEQFVKNKEYRKKHELLLNKEVKEFITWYDGKFNEVKKDKCGILFSKRDFNIHHGHVEQIFQIKQGPFTFSAKELKEGREIPVDMNKMKAFFHDIPDSNLIEICEDFLNKIKKIVDDTHTKFKL